MVIIIALLHCLPPIIGSFFGKTGLKIGIAIGVIAAFIFGALVFTVFDLMGVGLGALIGLSLLGRDGASDKPIKNTFKEAADSINRGIDAASDFFSKLIAILFLGTLVLGLGFELFKPEPEFMKTINSAKKSSFNDLTQSCNSGNKDGCLKLGIKYIGTSENPNDPRAIQAFIKGCNLDSGESCVRLASTYEIKDPSTMRRSNNLADLKTAFELYLKGCNLGDSGGCASVAGAYESGKLSVARSFENSLKFYERAKKLDTDDWFAYDGDIRRLKKKLHIN